jgi:predicted RNase H-like HicB family nuclease
LPRQFDVVIERDEEGYYVASVPQLSGCHTQARSLDEVTVRIREAIELCLEVEGAPEQSLEFIGIQRITVGTDQPTVFRVTGLPKEETPLAPVG